MFILASLLSAAKRAQIEFALVEGASLRATARMASVSRSMVNKLLLGLDTACARLQAGAIRDAPSKRIQCDEVWRFVYAKAKKAPDEREGEFGDGDVWAFTAIDADSKRCSSWLVGSSGAGTATDFMQDVTCRVPGRAQLTADRHKMHSAAVQDGFLGQCVDFAQLIKYYRALSQGPEIRYSPARRTGTTVQGVRGPPDPGHVSTTYVERANLTMGMSIRRFIRLTRAFSRKLEQHLAAISMHLMPYNSGLPHLGLWRERNK